MKTKYLIFLMILAAIFSSCLDGKRSDTMKEKDFLPGYILMRYVGITDKVKKFTLIRTSQNDSSFFVSQHRKEIGFLNDELFYRIYCNDYIANVKQFLELKRYIILHDTHKKNDTVAIDNYNAVEIVCVDQCASVVYVVNRTDSAYFTNMIHFIILPKNRTTGII